MAYAEPEGLMIKDISVNSLAEIRQAAREFVQAIGESSVFAFYGKMGVGKTTFIKAVCEELGVSDVVNSPTFAIVNEYLDGKGNPIYHFDFYRIKSQREVYDIGFDEYLDSGNLCFIEWPELIEDFLPEDTVKVHISEQPDGTRIIKKL